MVRSGDALYVPGNHCRKLYRYLSGADVMVRHGLETTVRELDALSRRERQAVSRTFRRLYDDAPPYMILDDGRLVVVHAGIKEDMIGRISKGIERFCLYGEATGERTPEGFPVRRDWARDYRGDALVVYGHTPVRDAVFRHNTVNIDQGCVFGGKLTALRYPEREIVQAPARAAYETRAAFRGCRRNPGARHRVLSRGGGQSFCRDPGQRRRRPVPRGFRLGPFPPRSAMIVGPPVDVHGVQPGASAIGEPVDRAGRAIVAGAPPPADDPKRSREARPALGECGGVGGRRERFPGRAGDVGGRREGRMDAGRGRFRGRAPRAARAISPRMNENTTAPLSATTP